MRYYLSGPRDCPHRCEEGHVTADEYVQCDMAVVALTKRLAAAEARAEKYRAQRDEVRKHSDHQRRALHRARVLLATPTEEARR